LKRHGILSSSVVFKERKTEKRGAQLGYLLNYGRIVSNLIKSSFTVHKGLVPGLPLPSTRIPKFAGGPVPYLNGIVFAYDLHISLHIL
jgi:hypothetical protein